MSRGYTLALRCTGSETKRRGWRTSNGVCRGIYNWLQYINTNFRFDFGKDWDENGTIRGGIKSDLAMISSGKINGPQLVADGERLGIGIEQEENDFRIQDLRS